MILEGNERTQVLRIIHEGISKRPKVDQKVAVC